MVKLFPRPPRLGGGTKKGLFTATGVASVPGIAQLSLTHLMPRLIPYHYQNLCWFTQTERGFRSFLVLASHVRRIMLVASISDRHLFINLLLAAIWKEVRLLNNVLLFIVQNCFLTFLGQKKYHLSTDLLFGRVFVYSLLPRWLCGTPPTKRIWILIKGLFLIG